LAALLGALALSAVLAPAPAHAAEPSGSTTAWLCRPGLADDPCEIPLDTTYVDPDGTTSVETPARRPQSKRKVDCFYVYPTVSNQVTPNASASAAPEVRSIAKYQAARYSSVCRIYAPLYRQVTFAGFPLGPVVTGDVAYGDVVAAWNSYLANDNKGRGVVLIGHSQGTLMLRKLIREHIETNPAVRARLVGAMLLGGNVMVAKGATTGGDFQNVPACTQRGEFGCVVAYSSYVNDPPPVAFFGNPSTDLAGTALGIPTKPGSQVLCTDPGPLSGDLRDFGVTVPSEPYAPGAIQTAIILSTYGQVPTAGTTWVSPADRFQGACKTINGATVFRYDPADAQTRRPLEFPPLWGTHIFDANLALEKLVSIVHQQAQAYLDSRGAPEEPSSDAVTEAPSDDKVIVADSEPSAGLPGPDAAQGSVDQLVGSLGVGILRR
jgi:hypothetical protein